MKNIILFILIAIVFSGCDVLFGKKEDKTVNEIFEQGKIDPQLYPNQVGYVPLLPFWTGISNPIDICAGYDEMLYVVDDNGVEIFDQKGTLQRTISIPGATDVTQDRSLHTYVAGRVNKTIGGITYNLAAVYHLMNASSASGPVFLDTLVHPFDDVSRNNSSFRGAPDEAVKFTGLATLADNTLYVSRTGPTNNLSSVSRPDNAVLIYNQQGRNIGYSIGLNPVSSSLKSDLGISSIATFAAPPQSITGISTSPDFMLLQDDPVAQYKALWIKQINDPDAGISFMENAALLATDLSKAERFLYTPNRFSSPKDIFIAPDFTGYIFIVDSGTDSLYQFTQKGYEGVNPPANSSFTKQVIASFGGEGSGPFQFNDPSGVCYYKRVIYVADKKNNRICRYKLSTDIE